MKIVTLCYCVKDNEVLLAMKKRGFGVGKWNGYGGKVEPGETVKAGALRELKEESALLGKENDLVLASVSNFYFDDVLVFECHSFVLNRWEGEPTETEEMRPQWFPQSALPLNEMWVSDQHWLQKALQGQKTKTEFYFNTDGSVINKYSVEEVESL